MTFFSPQKPSGNSKLPKASGGQKTRGPGKTAPMPADPPNFDELKEELDRLAERKRWSEDSDDYSRSDLKRGKLSPTNRDPRSTTASSAGTSKRQGSKQGKLEDDTMGRSSSILASSTPVTSSKLLT